MQMFTSWFSPATLTSTTFQLTNALVVKFVPIENGKGYNNIYPTNWCYPLTLNDYIMRSNKTTRSGRYVENADITVIFWEQD